MTLFASTAAPGHRWKMFLPTVPTTASVGVLNSRSASAALHRKWIEGALDPFSTGPVNCGRFVENSGYAGATRVASAKAIPGLISAKLQITAMQVLLTIVAILMLGFVLALVVSRVLLTIKADVSTAPQRRKKLRPRIQLFTTGGFKDAN